MRAAALLESQSLAWWKGEERVNGPLGRRKPLETGGEATERHTSVLSRSAREGKTEVVGAGKRPRESVSYPTGVELELLLALLPAALGAGGGGVPANLVSGQSRKTVGRADQG